MRWLLLTLSLAFAACGASTTETDLGLVASEGCRYPRACWLTSCGCTFALTNDPACRLCDPVTNGKDCICADYSELGDVQCLELEQLCIGKGPSCAGGFCVRAGTACDQTDGGDEPQVVPDDPSDGGPSVSPHCPFRDDVCCPRASTTPDAAAPDLSATD